MNKDYVPKGTIRSKKNKKSLSFSLKASTYFRIKLIRLKANTRVVLSTAVDNYLSNLLDTLEKKMNIEPNEYKKFINAFEYQEGNPCPNSGCGGKKKIVIFKKEGKEKSFIGCTNHPKCNFSEKIK